MCRRILLFEKFCSVITLMKDQEENGCNKSLINTYKTINTYKNNCYCCVGLTDGPGTVLINSYT